MRPRFLFAPFLLGCAASPAALLGQMQSLEPLAQQASQRHKSSCIAAPTAPAPSAAPAPPASAAPAPPAGSVVGHAQSQCPALETCMQAIASASAACTTAIGKGKTASDATYKAAATQCTSLRSTAASTCAKAGIKGAGSGL